MTPGPELPDLSRRSVLGLVAVGTLAGCGLSTDSTVSPGLKVDGPPAEPLMRTPNGPRRGAEPEDIIRGFVHAGSTSGEGLEVTRSFLTEDQSRGWIPDSQTVVYAGTDPKITPVKGQRDSYRVRVRVLATIDAVGRYTVAPPNLFETFDFHMTKVQGQWRIDRLEEGFGRLLQQDEVDVVFGDYFVHYPAIGWNALVVDRRWFPQDQLATRIARAQLGNVPEYLADAVSSDTKARLAVDAVPVRNGVAQVDLDVEAVSGDATVRKRLAAQLVASLMQVPEVSEVSITLSGNALDAGVDEPLTTQEQFGFTDRTQTSTPTVLARRGTEVITVEDQLSSVTARAIRRARSRFAAIPESSLLVGLRPDGKELAVLDEEHRELSRYRDDGGVVTLPPFAAAMSRPCYDYGGVLWVGGLGLGREEGRRLWAINATVDPGDASDAGPEHVPAPWLEQRFVVAAVVSPEGSRIAVISEARRGTGSVLEVAGVARRANGLPTKTSPEAFRVAADLVEMVDAVWVGESTLAVIGRQDDEKDMQPYLVHVGGRVQSMTERPGMTMVTTTGDHKDVVLTSDKGRVFERSGGRWQELKPLTGVIVAGL